MVNILLPALGNSMFFKDYYFPKLMLEIDGETILEKVVGNYGSLSEKHFIFVLSKNDCMKFHLDQSAKIITEPDSSMIILKNQTAGALCTSLIAVDYINNEAPLVIANCDQIIDVDYQKVIDDFDQRNLDAGVITFPSIHPRWSYVRHEGENIIEVAEKRPLSKYAIAGFYYFRHGADFVEAAEQAIMKEVNLEGQYYISASLNEMILMNKKVGSYEIAKEAYHSFYSPEKIQEYEKGILIG